MKSQPRPLLSVRVSHWHEYMPRTSCVFRKFLEDMQSVLQVNDGWRMGSESVEFTAMHTNAQRHRFAGFSHRRSIIG